MSRDSIYHPRLFLFKNPQLTIVGWGFLITFSLIFSKIHYQQPACQGTVPCHHDGDKGNDVLQDGDQLRIVIRAIDQRAYDYLYSMQHMSSTGTNPIDNFTGGCLGYFSAHSEIEFYREFHLSDVVEDEE